MPANLTYVPILYVTWPTYRAGSDTPCIFDELESMPLLKKSLTYCLFSLSIACFSLGLSVPAQAAYQDHALLSGMPSYVIDSRDVVEFGTFTGQREFECGASRKCNASDPGFSDGGKLVAEGKVTILRYANKGSGQTLAVARNYEAAIKSIGGRKLTWHEGYEGEQVFLIDKDGRRTWIVLENDYSPSYKLTFIEQKSMAQVVTAGQLADAINQHGFATLYINFDNNSAMIKADAKQAVDEIASLLSKDKTLRLSIEGHTDNVGNAGANKTLSNARAANVVKMLVQSGVNGKRLQSKGFGSEAPVADNRSEDGRAKNRRVELVKLK